MNRASSVYLLLFILACIGAGCANIVPPEGGKKDTVPPKLVAVKPGDSLLNTRVSKIELRFNEYIELKDIKEVQVSPLIPFPPTMVATGKKVTLTMEDSVLRPNTTYRVSFGKSVVDLHEGNPLKPYTYVFSTGSYFDSLRIDGIVINAATGKPDSGVNILLYEGSESDSIVVRKKPLYIGRTIDGKFTIAGLPDIPFKVFALKDANDNMIYDGKGERIGFIDSIVAPVDTIGVPLVFKMFEEKVPVTDTIEVDTTENEGGGFKNLKKRKRGGIKDAFNYTVNVDTSSITKRSLDITQPLKITFSNDVDSVNDSRIALSYDSVIIDTIVKEIEVPFTATQDSVRGDLVLINSVWKENTVYTLRLLKGFAKDSAGADVMPSKYRFRTKADEDYSKLTVNLPAKYLVNKYVLLVKNETDTVYNAPVTDTVVKIIKLQPGGYNMFIITDENGNGVWDTGDLFEKKQPEEVTPFMQTMQLKMGWDHTFDFVQEVKKPDPKKASPKKRDGSLGK
jgi:hypothetical protein